MSKEIQERHFFIFFLLRLFSCFIVHGLYYALLLYASEALLSRPINSSHPASLCLLSQCVVPGLVLVTVGGRTIIKVCSTKYMNAGDKLLLCGIKVEVCTNPGNMSAPYAPRFPPYYVPFSVKWCSLRVV